MTPVWDADNPRAESKVRRGSSHVWPREKRPSGRAWFRAHVDGIHRSFVQRAGEDVCKSAAREWDGATRLEMSYRPKGEPGRACRGCKVDDWWRLSDAHPWVCGRCHPGKSAR